MIGLAKAAEIPTSPQPVSLEAQRLADALIHYSKQVKGFPILRGVRYDGIAFENARARAKSLTEQAAQLVGTTTMDSNDFKQLLVGGANLMYTLGLNVRATSYFEGQQYRAYEERVRRFSDDFMVKMVELSQQAARSGALTGLRGGLGFLIVGIALILLAGYLLSLDDGEDLARDLCTQDSTSEACHRALAIYEENKRDPQDPFSSAAQDVSEAIASVIKWVGIGAAVLGVGYLLWTFGPLLIGGGRKIRERSKKRFA